jgi:hypothetical protein
LGTTACSKVQSDSTPTASALRARPIIASTLDTPTLTGMIPIFMRGSSMWIGPLPTERSRLCFE